MDLRKAATAGTMESNDIMVTLEPAEAGGIQIDLKRSRNTAWKTPP